MYQDATDLMQSGRSAVYNAFGEVVEERRKRGLASRLAALNTARVVDQRWDIIKLQTQISAALIACRRPDKLAQCCACIDNPSRDMSRRRRRRLGMLHGSSQQLANLRGP